MVFDPLLPFLLTFYFPFRLWNPKILDSWAEIQARGRRICGVRDKGEWETGTLSGVDGSRET